MVHEAEDLKKKFKDPKYRAAYADSLLDDAIALQIRKLREDRGLSQAELGKRAGMRQGAVSRIESADYGAWTVNTLKRIGAALDVPLSIRFESWGDLVETATNLTPDRLAVPSFEEDPKILGTTQIEYHGELGVWRSWRSDILVNQEPLSLDWKTTSWLRDYADPISANAITMSHYNFQFASTNEAKKTAATSKQRAA